MEIPQTPEKEKWEVHITVHRHGPKSSVSGPLSEEGKKYVADYFEDAYQGVAPRTENVEMESSPIHRAQETGSLYKKSASHFFEKSGPTKIDSRLSEGGIAETKALDDLKQKYGRGLGIIEGSMDLKDRPFPEVKTGTEIVRDFSQWILEKIESGKEKGGVREIDVVSHGLVIGPFLYAIQKETGEKIFPEDTDKANIFEKELGYLSYINLWVNSSEPEILNLAFNSKVFQIPVKIIKKLSGK